MNLQFLGQVHVLINIPNTEMGEGKCGTHRDHRWQLSTSFFSGTIIFPCTLQRSYLLNHWRLSCHARPSDKESPDKGKLGKSMKKQRHHFADKGLYSQSYGFSSSLVWVWELDHERRLSTEELMLRNCGAGEDSWESLGLQGDPTSPS